MTVNAVVTEEDGTFVVSNPDTGVTSQGETLELALANLKEALGLYLEEAGTHQPNFSQHAYLTTITL